MEWQQEKERGVFGLKAHDASDNRIGILLWPGDAPAHETQLQVCSAPDVGLAQDKGLKCLKHLKSSGNVQNKNTQS